MRIVLFALALSLCLSAQAPTGEITGTVTDPSGAVLSGATPNVNASLDQHAAHGHH
jgi:hypothetical protein